MTLAINLFHTFNQNSHQSMICVQSRCLFSVFFLYFVVWYENGEKRQCKKLFTTIRDVQRVLYPPTKLEEEKEKAYFRYINLVVLQMKK